jgi:hypothetical protein
MGKLCAKGKAAAKRKYDVYPSAYANMYASAVCSGKVKSKANGGAIASNRLSQKRKKVSHLNKGGIARGCGAIAENKRKRTTIN